MIHVASLIHDDVLDEAEVRRGGMAVHKLYSNKVGYSYPKTFETVSKRLICPRGVNEYESCGVLCQKGGLNCRRP